MEHRMTDLNLINRPLHTYVAIPEKRNSKYVCHLQY